MATGSCLCGAFTYSVEGSFGEVRYCHCKQCRKGNGSAFSANARVNISQWKLDGPAEQVSEYEYKPGRLKAFCAKCGSPLYARVASQPDSIRVRLGGFDDVLDAKITGHAWVSSKAAWFEISDELPRHSQGATS